MKLLEQPSLHVESISVVVQPARAEISMFGVILQRGRPELTVEMPGKTRSKPIMVQLSDADGLIFGAVKLKELVIDNFKFYGVWLQQMFADNQALMAYDYFEQSVKSSS